MLSVKPKLIVAAIVLALVAGGAWHYRHVIAENADLTKRLLQAMQENDSLATQLEEERKAAAIAVRERRMAEDALAALQAGQAADTTPEFVEWSAQRIPPTEKARICAALPEMVGCERP
jgi:hypothetical protein